MCVIIWLNWDSWYSIQSLVIFSCNNLFCGTVYKDSHWQSLPTRCMVRDGYQRARSIIQSSKFGFPQCPANVGRPMAFVNNLEFRCLPFDKLMCTWLVQIMPNPALNWKINYKLGALVMCVFFACQGMQRYRNYMPWVKDDISGVRQHSN